jgi:5-methylcytosine-specific restriction endonuclease McrA
MGTKKSTSRPNITSDANPNFGEVAAPCEIIAAPMQFVLSVLQELKDLGVLHTIGSYECLDIKTIVAAIKYQRATGRNPVKERHVIADAENYSQAYGSNWVVLATESERQVADDVLNRGFWKVSDEVRENLQRMLSEANRRESYTFRREEANLHIAKPSIRKRIFKRDGHRCLRCGKADRLSVDHVVAVANGGGNEDENLQTLCRSCNSSKGAKASYRDQPTGGRG